MRDAILIAVCAAFAAISLINFILYGADKRRARKNLWRIPERVLLLLSFFGGAVGGTAGMLVFRHKTKKFRFIFINALGLIWQAAAVILIAVYMA